MNTTEHSKTTDVRTVSNTRNTGNINAINTTRTLERNQFLVVSILWVLSIILLTYLEFETNDIRTEVFILLATMIGVPIILWTYIQLKKARGS